ncbi:MAG: transketolase family protein [Phototrophicaceae bacterium]
MDFGTNLGLELGTPTRDAFGETLVEIGENNPNLVVVDSDLNDSTRTKFFKERFPARFINVGIAESNMVGVASGLAASGKDVLASSFAAFLLGNAYDQIRMSIAYPNLPVKLVGSHSGISPGEDGPSQMAIEDMALAASFPNMTVLVPADAPATRWATSAMFQVDGPVYLRTSRPAAPVVYASDNGFTVGKAKQVRHGGDVTIIACGLMVSAALEAAALLSSGYGIEARVLDMHTIKPIDREAIERAAHETSGIVTAEEHSITGGLGAAVSQIVSMTYPVPMAFVAIMDEYTRSGDPKELFELFGLSPGYIVQAAARVVRDRQR